MNTSRSVKRRAAGLAAAMVVTAAVAMAGAGPAIAGTGDPVPAPPGNSIGANWANQTTHTTWNGAQYTTVEVSFTGDRVASPGDSVQRTLNIVNNGPSDATMSVSLLAHQTVPGSAPNPQLAQAIGLFWNINGSTGQDVFADVLTGQQPDYGIGELKVPQGATVPVTVGYSMDASAPDNLIKGAPSTILDFDVVVRMQGDTVAPESHTGGTLAANWVAPALGLLVCGAVAFAVVVVRRRSSDEGETGAHRV